MNEFEPPQRKSRVYTWNPTDPCFEWKGPSFGGFKPQNRGQTGSRYLQVVVSKMRFFFYTQNIRDMIPNLTDAHIFS